MQYANQAELIFSAECLTDVLANTLRVIIGHAFHHQEDAWYHMDDEHAFDPTEDAWCQTGWELGSR